MMLPWLLLVSSGVVYATAFIFHAQSFLEIRERGHVHAAVMLRAGFALQTFALLFQSIQSGSLLPVVSLSQALAFFAWALAFVYLVLLGKVRSESFGLILNPILFLFVLAASIAALLQKSEPVSDLLKNPYFAVHIVAAFFAYASFALSFAAAILFLVQRRQLKQKHAGQLYHKLPSLEELERLTIQPLICGTPLLAAAVFIGILWSEAAFGHSKISDPKTIFTLFITALYILIVALKKSAAANGKRLAIWSIAAFSIVIVGFIGIRFCPESYHYSEPKEASVR